MTATIAYDLPMKNLIDELSATGHVTHTAYRKTMVTIHHNGGRLSHEGCLRVWQTRPASAHFDIDGVGAACQYVKVNEYAWACASTTGNQKSISIEMANSSLAPSWLVSDITWKRAARLAGWLFARVIGTRPTKATLVFHHYWYATACAGPYMDSIYARLLAAAQAAYDAFTAPPPPPAVKGPPVMHTLVRLDGTKAVWLSDLITRRWVTSEAELLVVQARLKAHGLPTGVTVVSSLDPYGVAVGPLPPA